MSHGARSPHSRRRRRHRVRGALTDFLASREAVTAQNAGDAFILVAVAPPDVVQLDIAMPIISGLSTVRRIHAVHPELPIIMTTANVDLAAARDTLKLGAFD